MASNKPRHQKTLSDEGPIVFPVPTSNPSDVFPPDFKQPSDLVVDPYGNFYCFVCQVSVPKGDSNVSQHLSGKKHDTHNRRFASEQQKDQVRQRVLQAALQQRIARGVPLFTADAVASPANHSLSVQTPLAPAIPVPTKQTSSVNPDVKPTCTPPTASENFSSPAEQLNGASVRSTAPGAERKTRKAKRLAEARRLRAMQIDKKAFLSDVLADDEESESESDSADPDIHHSSAFDLSQRQKPFGPLVFKRPEGPDYFLESMAEETAPSGAAAKVREILTKKDMILSKDPESASEQTKTLKEHHDAEEFLSFGNIGKDEAELTEERERAKAREKARESFIILKHENGEKLPPWLLNPEATEKVLYSGDSSVSLHYEILEFCQFVSPTQAELDSRNELIMTVEAIVKQLWPSSTIEIYGSYATGLHLPSSDIDICVLGTPCGGEMKEFDQLAQAIRNVTGFARRVDVIKATVNLVKIISRKTSMNCDISIGVANGPKYVPIITKYVQTYPALRPLLLVIKCFLQQRDLNEVYYGGLGSYSVLLLIVSHLQMLKYNFQTPKTNLGALLQLFFQLYGRMHNLCLAGMQVKDNGCYYDKFERYQTAPKEVLRFSIEDPNDVSNELGRNSYAASRVRKTFANASKSLLRWRREDSSVPPTPLSVILQPDELFRFRRTGVIEDLEKKGKEPLRESLGALHLARSESSSQAFVREKSTPATPRGGSTDSKHTGAHASSKRASSPDRRRERDPRLVKRRRTATESDRTVSLSHSQTDAYGSGGGTGNANNSHGNSNNTNMSYQSVSTVPSSAVFNQTMGYNQNTFTQQGYAPATPGYQYVGNQMYVGNDMTAAFPTQNFVPTPQQTVLQQNMRNVHAMGQSHSQYIRNHDNRGLHHGRGRPVKREYRPRRGNYRG